MAIENRLDEKEMAMELEVLKSELALPKNTSLEDIEKALDEVSNLKIIQTLSPTSLSEYAVLFGCYSIDLTMYENRIKSFVKWCEGNIQYIIGRNLANTPYSFFSEKASYIRSNEEHAIALDKARNASEAKLEYIKFLSQKMAFLSDRVQSLAEIKNREQKRYAN